MRSALGVALVVTAAGAGEAAAQSLQPIGEFDSPVYIAGAPATTAPVRRRAGGHDPWYATARPPCSPTSAQPCGRPATPAPASRRACSRWHSPRTSSRAACSTSTSHDSAGDNRVEELRAPSGDAVDPASRRARHLAAPPDQHEPQRGQLQFGPDGRLYLGPGDGGRATTRPATPRASRAALGKILRIDPRGGAPYLIPPDNPFAGQAGARGEIWAYGLRNPFRFSFDRPTGDLVIADVGQGTIEEVDLAGGHRHRSGRELRLGPLRGQLRDRQRDDALRARGRGGPVIDNFQSQGYRLRDHRRLRRARPLAAVARGPLRLRRLLPEPAADRLLGLPGPVDDREIGPTVEVTALSSFGEDTAGCVYASSRTGPVYRLVESDRDVPCGTSGGSDGPEAPERPPRPWIPQPPGLRARVPRRQRLLRLGGAVAYRALSRELRPRRRRAVARRRSPLRLRRAGRLVPPGLRIRVKVRLTRPARRALRRRLGRRRFAYVRVGLRARDAAGNRSRLVPTRVRARR